MKKSLLVATALDPISSVLVVGDSQHLVALASSGLTLAFTLYIQALTRHNEAVRAANEPRGVDGTRLNQSEQLRLSSQDQCTSTSPPETPGLSSSSSFNDTDSGNGRSSNGAGASSSLQEGQQSNESRTNGLRPSPTLLEGPCNNMLHPSWAANGALELGIANVDERQLWKVAASGLSKRGGTSQTRGRASSSREVGVSTW